SGNNPSTVWVAASSNGGFDVLGSHTYTEEQSATTFTVTVTDHDASTGGSATINVADAALSTDSLSVPAATEGQPFDSVVLLHFSDADPGGTVSDYTATVNWGAGTVEYSGSNPSTVWVAASSGGGFDVLGSHTYE